MEKPFRRWSKKCWVDFFEDNDFTTSGNQDDSGGFSFSPFLDIFRHDQ